MPHSIDEVLAQARTQLRRLEVADLPKAVADGAILVDIRPREQRAREGAVPGALLIERNVLEWRLDPSSSARIALASDYSVKWAVLCSAGYASSLAAASLQHLGLTEATDIVGGFQAMQAAGAMEVAADMPWVGREAEAGSPANEQ